MKTPNVNRSVLIPSVLAISVLCLLGLALWGPVVSARMLGLCTVPSGQYTTMADAVGDTNCTIIQVMPGTHSTNITITHDLTILGSGADQTFLDGGSAGRVIYNDAKDISISGVTIQNGLLTGSTNSGFGAGIRNEKGNLILLDSRIINNQAENAAGIYSNGFFSSATAVLTNVEISGNQATNGVGSGLYNVGGSRFTLANVTISGNHAVQWGALYSSSQSDFEIINSSIISNTSNGGGSGTGIGNGSKITLTNSIVAFNGNSVESNCGGNGTYTSLGYNLENASSCDFSEPSDLSDTDPKVSALADNGGPSWTHALLASSPAIDSGTNSNCPATDQRHAPRPVNSTCDRGAYEFDGTVPNPTPTATATAGPTSTPTATPTMGPSPTPTPTNTPIPNVWYVDASSGDDGHSCLSETAACLTINAAIGKAGHTHTIHIAAGTYNENVVVDKALTIMGAGADVTILDGQQVGRTMFIDWTSNAIVSGVTIRNGKVSATLEGNIGGGGIANIGMLALSDSRVVNNEADGGGGITNRGSLTLHNVEISGNTATGDTGGGGLRADGTGQVEMENVTISGNTAVNYGSGISNWGPMTIVNSTIADNTGVDGLFNFIGQTLTIQNSIISHTDIANCTNDSATSAGNNVENKDECGFNGTGDQVDTDPMLEGLANNDGNGTYTQALPQESPAVDAANNGACPATDQRGVTRPIDGDGDGTAVCDIGAYESPQSQWNIYLPFVAK